MVRGAFVFKREFIFKGKFLYLGRQKYGDGIAEIEGRTGPFGGAAGLIGDGQIGSTVILDKALYWTIDKKVRWG